MKFAVESLRRRYPADIVVSFFIHGRGVLLQRSPLGVFRALLSSLLREFPTHLQDVTEQFKHQEERFGGYERKDGWTWTEPELEEFLLQVLSRGTDKHPVVIYVDALDECGEHDAKRLLRFFTNIMSMVEGEQGLSKICFSSRHYPILGLETIPTLLVEGRNSKDIRLVVQRRLKQLNLRERRHQIENEILKRAQGGFQWAIMVTDIIRNEVLRGLNSASLHQSVTAIPEDLQKVYEFILSNAEGQERSQMVKLFQWVLFSERPLSSHELREALVTSQDMTCTTTSELRDNPNYSYTVSDFEIRVRHISRGMLEFQSREVWEIYQTDGEDWDREVQFIHQSAADFVLQSFLRNVDIGHSLRSVDGLAHFEISRSCLKYMTLQDILESSHESRRKLSVKFPLLPYAVTFLFRHINLVEQGNITQTDLLELVQWHQTDRLRKFLALWLTMDPGYSHAPMGWPFLGATATHVLVALGSATSLQAYLNHNPVDFDAKDCHGNTPLLLSLREGQEDLALLLIDRSVALHTKQRSLVRDGRDNERQRGEVGYLSHLYTTNSDGETPLGVAVSIRAHGAIYSLLRAGADPKTERGLLFYAIGNLNRPLLSDLIQRQVCLDGAVFFTVQTLRGSHQGNQNMDLDEILSSLLKAGADTRKVQGVVEEYNLAYTYYDDDEDEDDEAVIVASRNGLASVVELLVSHGVSPFVRDINGDYPFQVAARNGRSDIVEVLSKASLESNQVMQAHINSVLYDTVDVEETDIATLLFENLCRDGVPSDILMHCVLRSKFELAQFALQSEKGIRSTSDDWLKSILWLALDSNGDAYAMVKLILRTCAVDLSVENNDGATPLGWCLSRGRRDLVKLILDTGKVDIYREGKTGESPFWWTMRQGENSVIELLLGLDKRNIHRKDSFGLTGFWWLTEGRRYERGRVAIAKAALHGKLFNHNTS